MVKIPAGPFLMGTNSAIAYPADGEGPRRSVQLDEFWIDETSVTNLDFSEFVQATGYQTEAELLGWSFVPSYLISESDKHHVVGQSENTPWWMGVNGADWLHPLGPNSSIAEILDHPVVHISWNDANSFAQWSGKRLPTEAEWEKAARGGNENSIYPWGDELNLDGKFACISGKESFQTLILAMMDTLAQRRFTPLHQMDMDFITSAETSGNGAWTGGATTHITEITTNKYRIQMVQLQAITK